MLTKKAKLETFDALQRRHDLLERYFWDSRNKLTPDAVVHEKAGKDHAKLSVYGTERGDGGYIVVELNPGMPTVCYYDEWRSKVQALPFAGEYTHMMKRAAETLRVKLYRAVLTAEDIHPIALDGDGASEA